MINSMFFSKKDYDYASGSTSADLKIELENEVLKKELQHQLSSLREVVEETKFVERQVYYTIFWASIYLK